MIVLSMKQSKNNIYLLLARLTVVVHLLIMLWLWIGAWLAFKYPWYAPVHVCLPILIVWLHVRNGSCPVTDLEIDLRKKAGAKPDWSSFYTHYLFMQFFNYKPSSKFVKNFLIITKIIPGLSPLYVIVSQLYRYFS